MSQDEQDFSARQDAQIAQHARRSPGAFARWLASLSGAERREAQERLTRGQAWLGRNGRQRGDEE